MSDKVMNGISYAGAGASVVAGFTLTEWGVIIGIVTALITLGANLLYQHRKDRRERQLHALELRRLCQQDTGQGRGAAAVCELEVES